jgi:hypothetical protein
VVSKKALKESDYEKLSFVYENTVDDASLNELKQIIAFSEPLFIDELKKGKNIFDFAEQHIISNHIGIMPIYKKEGYFILYPFQSKQVQVYNYTLSKLNLLEQEVYGLNCSYFSTLHFHLQNQ